MRGKKNTHIASVLLGALALLGSTTTAASTTEVAVGRAAELLPPVEAVAERPVEVATAPTKAAGATCADHGDGTRSCVDYTPGNTGSAAPVGAESTWCDAFAAGNYWLTRFEGCVHGGVYTYTLFSSGGAVIGTASFSYQQETALNATNLGWSDETELTPTAVSPSLTGLTVTAIAGCLGCSVAANSTWGDLVVQGDTIYGGADFTANPGTNGALYVSTNYSMTFLMPGASPSSPLVIPGPPTLRCDSQVGASAGCAFTAATPVLQYSLSDPTVAQAAVAYRWAQLNLSTGWGLAGNPLHREADPATQIANRAATCDSTFVRSTVYNTPDSCDEFAFAASKESPALKGWAGSSCAEVYPYKMGTSWYVSVISAGTNPCVRAHVLTAVNTAAGAKIGHFVVNGRVLDNDPYLVNIAP
ncbi:MULTISPECIES: hypothetical protein [Actinosynnema]|uniref:hypothetical protein n=1 Tax=Actinosynnema TaxID=40566 RepID=UPI0020A5DE13|nr:hypothetical protein [Actinosynnema pretiosum]MCP2097362.1 hypothetical protein [Actinosynnema pretiosum]